MPSSKRRSQTFSHRQDPSDFEGWDDTVVLQSSKKPRQSLVQSVNRYPLWHCLRLVCQFYLGHPTRAWEISDEASDGDLPPSPTSLSQGATKSIATKLEDSKEGQAHRLCEAQGTGKKAEEEAKTAQIARDKETDKKQGRLGQERKTRDRQCAAALA